MIPDDAPIEEENSPPEPGEPVTSRQFLGLERTALTLFVIFASIFIWNAASCLWDISRGAWPTTNGRIVEVKELPGPRGWLTGRQVYYSFRTGSQSYDSHTYFAPRPGQPVGDSYSAGQEAPVYYNWFFPWMSTLAPTSQCWLYVVYMILGATAAIITLLGRPSLTMGGEMRAELPNFLDCLAALIESGVSVPAAFEQSANTCSGSCPKLSTQISQCVLKLKVSRIPLQQSLAQLGATYHLDELNNLASSIAAAEQTNSSVAYQIKQQSGALRYHLKAEQLAQENASSNFGARWSDSPDKHWTGARKTGPMSPEEILESLNQEREKK
jgi:Flp pilus assembly protein TadB